MIHDPITMLMCSPTSDGAAATVLVSEEFVKKHGLERQAIEIIGMAMAVRFSSFSFLSRLSAFDSRFFFPVPNCSSFRQSDRFSVSFQ